MQGLLNQAAGRQVDMTVVMLAMGPCCKTFSRADSSNTARDNNYRLHGEGSWHSPPKDKVSQKGLEAHMAVRQDGAAGHRYQGGTGGAQDGGAVLHEEPCGVSGQEAIHAAVGEWVAGGLEVGGAQGGALLCVRSRALLPQANTHLDQHVTLDADRQHGGQAVQAEVQRRLPGEGEVGAQVPPVPGQQGCTWGSGQEGNEKHDALGAPCGASGGICRHAVKAVEGTAGQPGGEVRRSEGASGAGGGLEKAEVGEKRDPDRQERVHVVHRGSSTSGRTVSALLLIRQVQPTGVTPKRQRKMTHLNQKHTSVKTARDGTGKKVTKKSRNKTEEKKENRNNTRKVVGGVGESEEGARQSEGDKYVHECGISDQNAALKDKVEWVSGFDCGWARARYNWAPERPRPGPTSKHPGAI